MVGHRGHTFTIDRRLGLDRKTPMATSEQKVKAVHPKAAKKRYSKTGGGS